VQFAAVAQETAFGNTPVRASPLISLHLPPESISVNVPPVVSVVMAQMPEAGHETLVGHVSPENDVCPAVQRPWLRVSVMTWLVWPSFPTARHHVVIGHETSDNVAPSGPAGRTVNFQLPCDCVATSGIQATWNVWPTATQLLASAQETELIWVPSVDG
jgi:hypothetical protein